MDKVSAESARLANASANVAVTWLIGHRILSQSLKNEGIQPRHGDPSAVHPPNLKLHATRPGLAKRSIS